MMIVLAQLASSTAATLPMFRGIDFDWTINLGQVGIVGTFLFSIGAWVASQRGGLRTLNAHLQAGARSQEKLEIAIAGRFADALLSQQRLESGLGARFEKIEARLEGQHEILVKIAAQEVRLDAHEKRIDGFDGRLAAALDEIGRLRTFGVQQNNRVIEGSRS